VVRRSFFGSGEGVGLHGQIWQVDSKTLLRVHPAEFWKEIFWQPGMCYVEKASLGRAGVQCGWPSGPCWSGADGPLGKVKVLLALRSAVGGTSGKKEGFII
jgi:hypothetical protein